MAESPPQATVLTVLDGWIDSGLDDPPSLCRAGYLVGHHQALAHGCWFSGWLAKSTDLFTLLYVGITSMIPCLSLFSCELPPTEESWRLP